MTPSTIGFLIMVLGILAMSGIGLIGLRTVVSAWIKRKELSGQPDTEKLLDAIETLRAETYDMREQLTGEIAELNERIDFAERLLTKGSQGTPGAGRQD